MINFDTMKVRQDFPFLKQKINGKPILYFDNAATTHKPIQVLNTIRNFYSKYNAAINRSTHSMGDTATLMYTQAHEKVARFIGADSYREIIFTRNSTEAINLVCYSLWMSRESNLMLSAGDEVIIPIIEHHSDFVPWQRLQDLTGVAIRYVKITEDGIINPDDVRLILSEKTRLICCSHVSNVLGTINPVKEIGQIAHEVGAYFLVDGTQSAPHMAVDVKDIGCDFFVFSGHKMLAPSGIGVLYGKKHLLERMPPFLTGGGMIKKVSFENTTWNDLPWKFEAGTPDVCGAIALGGVIEPHSGEDLIGAIDYLGAIGMSDIHNHEKKLCEYTISQLSQFDDIIVYGPKECSNKCGIILFNIMKNNEIIDSHIVTNLLDEEGIAARSGWHCAYPLMQYLEIDGSVRLSFYLYNTIDEIDRFIESLRLIIEKKLV